MVNSKKMNKSTVAVIVLALLLVLSLILTATGAWFTDKKDGDEITKNFGTVALKVDESKFGEVTRVSHEAGTVDGKVMPGDSINYTLTISKDAGSEDFWYGVTVTISGLGEDHNIETTLTAENIHNTTEASGEISGSVKLTGEDFDNTYQGTEIKISYTVYAVQYANVADAATALPLLQAAAARA